MLRVADYVIGRGYLDYMPTGTSTRFVGLTMPLHLFYNHKYTYLSTRSQLLTLFLQMEKRLDIFKEITHYLDSKSIKKDF